MRHFLRKASTVCHAGAIAITRLWRGWTDRAVADEYERLLLNELFPSMRRISGFLGAEVARRADGADVAFVTLTRFESIEDMCAFAGDLIDVPVIEPEAAEWLTRFDERVAHYETAVFSV